MKVKRLVFILIPLIFIVFTSCNNRPIFSVIEQEINLKKFSIEGNILSLVEKNGNIYVANRAGIYVRYKNFNGTWSGYESSAGIQQLASNVDSVFACFASGAVKYYKDKNWVDVPSSENIRMIAGDKIVFGYDDKQEKVFMIGSSGPIGAEIYSGKIEGLAAAGDYVLVKSGKSAKLYKVGASAALEVAGLPEGAKDICADISEAGLFVLAGSAIHYYDGSAWSDNKISISQKPVSLSYFKERNTIFVGCSKGYTEVQLDNAKPIDFSKAKQVNPGEAGSTTPSSSYSQYQTTLESYYSSPILGVERVEAGIKSYAVFMGISSGVIQRNTGLWSFYSDKREWNRE